MPRSPLRQRVQPQFEPLESRNLLATNPIISEFMADNLSVIRDGYEKSPDWIEIYNPGEAPADLTGWHLTDSPQDLTKWTFPSTTLDPGGYLVVFASGRGTPNPGDAANLGPAGNLHTNFELNAAADYVALVSEDGFTIASEYGTAGGDYPPQTKDISYGISQQGVADTLIDRDSAAYVLLPAAELPSGWAGDDPEFDDDPTTSAWLAATTPIGFDTTDAYDFALGTQGDIEAAMQGVYSSALIRIPFDVADPTAIDQLLLEAAFDDGFAAYLNGHRVADANAPVTLSASSAATATHDALGGGYLLDPENTSVLYTFENNTGQIFTDKLTDDGSQQPLVEFNGPGGLFIDGDAANAAFGARSLRLANATFPEFNRFEIADTADLGNRFTLAMTVDLDRLGFQRLFSNYQGTGAVGTNRLIFDIDPSGGSLASGMRLLIGGRGGVEPTQRPAALSQAGYHHIAVTYDNGAVRAYLDGTVVMTGTLGSGPLEMPLNLFVGEDPHDGGGTANEQLVGNLDDVLVLQNVALSQAEINVLATAGANAFFTTGGNAASFELFPLGQHIDKLHTGENVLAIHALNSSSADSDFFFLPRLTATTLPGDGQPGYFDVPTPGAPNGAALGGLVDDTRFSVDRGFFNATV